MKPHPEHLRCTEPEARCERNEKATSMNNRRASLGMTMEDKPNIRWLNNAMSNIEVGSAKVAFKFQRPVSVARKSKSSQSQGKERSDAVDDEELLVPKGGSDPEVPTAVV